MRQIPNHITDPVTRYELGLIAKAQKLLSIRHREIVLLMRSNQITEALKQERIKILKALDALEKRWQVLAPSIAELAVLLANSPVR